MRLLSTHGLVLHTTNYSETSVIAKVFTRQLGVKSYIVKGVRGGRSRVKQNLLQPLSYLDMVVYNNPHATINYVKEMRPAESFRTLSTNSVSASVVFFMGEILYKTLREEEPNQPLFDYVTDTLCSLDSAAHISGSLPVCYLLKVSRYLGIEPLDNYSRHEPCFNLKEGRYMASPSGRTLLTDPNADYFLDGDTSERLHRYLEALNQGDTPPMMPLAVRTHLINTLLLYYQTHLTDFRNFKSHEILHAVLE